MHLDILMAVMGVVFFLFGGRALSCGFVKTRANFKVQYWYRDKNPVIFWIFTGIYLAIACVFTVYGALIHFGVIAVCIR